MLRSQREMSAACTRGTALDEVKRLLFDYQDRASSPEIQCYGVGRGDDWHSIGFPLAESKAGLCEHSMAKARQFSKRLQHRRQGLLVECYEMSMHSGPSGLASAYVT
jgi:hypothetical protein